MADMTLCRRENCSDKLSCKRYMTKGNPDRQSYADFHQHDVTGYCEYFIPIVEGPYQEDPTDEAQRLLVEEDGGKYNSPNKE